MTSTPSNTPNTGRSLDRQITTKDVDCLSEAFALFDIDRKEVITTALWAISGGHADLIRCVP